MDLPIGSEPAPPAISKNPFLSWLGYFMAWGFLLLLTIAIFYPRTSVPPSQGQFVVCTCNLKSIGASLQEFASGHHGHYPHTLDPMKKMPTCPAAGRVTYTDYQVSTTPDNFTLSCCGNFHAKALADQPGNTTNLPAYSGKYGLLTGLPSKL